MNLPCSGARARIGAREKRCRWLTVLATAKPALIDSVEELGLSGDLSPTQFLIRVQ